MCNTDGCEADASWFVTWQARRPQSAVPLSPNEENFIRMANGATAYCEEHAGPEFAKAKSTFPEPEAKVGIWKDVYYEYALVPIDGPRGVGPTHEA